MRTLILLVLGALVGLFVPRSAYADEVAPELEGADLRVRAQAELKKLFTALPRDDQRRLAGTYAAFDPNVGDPIAQIACDEDGDHVVVLSDAMLRLVAHVARAESYDEANGSRKLEDYASFLVRSQTPGRRLLPPPPGFYVAEKPATTYDDRLADVLSFVVGRELAHLRAGDLVCPKPTATKESGDDVWTAAEQRKAAEIATVVYPGRQMERDDEALVRIVEGGRTNKGALGLLRFFAQVEVERRVVSGRFAPTYLAHHPSASLRMASLKQAIDAEVRDHE